MTSLHAATKTKFAAKRYMDDILLLMQKEGWDRQRFYEDFKRSECYARPLNLEEATDGTFLVLPKKQPEVHLWTSETN